MNMWNKIVGHCDCIQPCKGHPVLKFKAGKVGVEADDLPVYVECSECGCVPLSTIQPELVKRYLMWWIKHARHPHAIARRYRDPLKTRK